MGQTAGAALANLLSSAKNAPHPSVPNVVASPWVNLALRYPETSAGELAAKNADVSRANLRDAEVLRQWWLTEMIDGAAPLRENLVLFFHSVLGGSSRTIDSPHALYGYNALLRRSVFGTIPDLLEALVLEPAMMMQENYDESRRELPSEYAARQILSKWTVGPEQFKDEDAECLARAITGWTLQAPSGQGPTRELDPRGNRANRRTGLVPTFHADLFDKKPKTILGTTREFGAKDAVRYLAMQDATARRWGRLLIDYFGVKDEGGKLELRLAETYRISVGSVPAMLETLVASDEFWSVDSRWSLVKSPVHLAVGACRQMDLREAPIAAISAWLGAAGQKLFESPSLGAEGWKGQDAWLQPAERLAARYALGNTLAGDGLPWGLRPGRQTLSNASALDAVSHWTLKDVAVGLDVAPGLDRKQIEQQLRGIAAERRTAEAIRRVMATPEYQVA